MHSHQVFRYTTSRTSAPWSSVKREIALERTSLRMFINFTVFMIWFRETCVRHQPYATAVIYRWEHVSQIVSSSRNAKAVRTSSEKFIVLLPFVSWHTLVWISKYIPEVRARREWISIFTFSTKRRMELLLSEKNVAVNGWYYTH